MEAVGLDIAFWSGRRVFLTGHTGFKGSWMSLWLQQLGCEVTGYALEPNTYPSLFCQAEVARGMTSVIGDIRDQATLEAAVQAADPEIMIHMAAQPLVGYSFDNPLETYDVNVIGTARVLEACRGRDALKAIVVVTTDKCYENRDWHWGYREDEPMGGFDPYSSSKACAELVTSAYRNSFFKPKGLPLASARAGNVIGGGDWAADRLVPDILRALEAGTTPKIRNFSAIRPWQHVLEPIRGYMMLAEHLVIRGMEYAEAWNFGPEDRDARPVSDIVSGLMRRAGRAGQWQVTENHVSHEAHHLKLDISKAKARLGWIPRLDFAQALDLITQWTEEAGKTRSVREVTVEQILNYQKMESSADVC